ncbi:MAG: hypothetical protein HY304_06680, partial [candidate division Zixibacteria bacterium]|nr:hypothetical protein [candidate division Zixibacteria bacterium]
DEITFDEFLELLEAHRDGTDGTFLPQSDWEGLPGSEAGYLSPPDSAQTLTEFAPVTQSSNLPVRWSARSGYDAALSTPTGGDGYTVGRFAWSNVRGLVDWRHDGDRGVFRRRTVAWSDHGVTAQAGSIEPRWGRGLVIGRRSRVIGTSNLSGSFWQPTRSRFNGIWVSTDERHFVNAGTMFSDIRSDSLIDHVGAAQITMGRPRWRLGLNAASGEIEWRDRNASFQTHIVSGHIQAGTTQRQVLAELATDDDGHTAKAAEAVWAFPKGQIHGWAWSYSEQFINPWGGGPGSSDTREVALDSIDVEFASRTAGERGFQLSTRVTPNHATTWRWEWMTHREGLEMPLIHRWTARCNVHARRWSVTPFARGQSVEGQAATYAIGSFGEWGDDSRQVNARAEFGRHRIGADRYVRAGAGLHWRLNAHVRLSPAMRWVDPDLDQPADGYWYFYFTETLLPVAGSRIEAALVWQRYEDREHGDRVELRIRLLTRPM